MSIDGARLGSTRSTTYWPVAKNRCRMSLRLVATLKPRIGTSMRSSIQPAKTLPKLPVGTTNSIRSWPDALGAVERAREREGVHVRRAGAGHLAFLQRRDASVGVQDEDGGAGLAEES